MSIFKPNLDTFSSKSFVAPKNEYEVEIASSYYKTVEVKTGKNPGTKHIVGFNTKIVSDTSGDKEYADKPIRVDFWLDEDPDSFTRLLRFAMTCMGITPGTDAADEQFREKAADLDFSVDTESGTLGGGFASLVNSRVNVNVDVRTNGDRQNQDFKGSRPI